MIVIDDEMLHSINKSESELRKELACWLYDKQAMSLHRAAAFCNQDYYTFMQELSKRGYSIMDEDSVLREIQNRAA